MVGALPSLVRVILSYAYPAHVPSKKGETVPLTSPHTIMSAEFDPAIPRLVDPNVGEPFRNIEDSEVESNRDQIVNKFVFYTLRSALDVTNGSFFSTALTRWISSQNFSVASTPPGALGRVMLMIL